MKIQFSKMRSQVWCNYTLGYNVKNLSFGINLLNCPHPSPWFWIYLKNERRDKGWRMGTESYKPQQWRTLITQPVTLIKSRSFDAICSSCQPLTSFIKEGPNFLLNIQKNWCLSKIDVQLQNFMSKIKCGQFKSIPPKASIWPDLAVSS